MKAAGVLALALVLLGGLPAGAQRPAPDDQHLIVPGQRIGPLKVGMTITEAVGIMGAPKSTWKDADGNLWYAWYENIFRGPTTPPSGGFGLYAVCSPQGEILRVIVHDDPQYRTQNGAHTGMTEPELRAIMGTPLRTVEVTALENFLFYDGIRFLVLAPGIELVGTVVEIAVFRP